jgi:hypothetical protein
MRENVDENEQASWNAEQPGEWVLEHAVHPVTAARA